MSDDFKTKAAVYNKRYNPPVFNITPAQIAGIRAEHAALPPISEAKSAPTAQGSVDWMMCERIASEDHVDEALRVFSEDATLDNATGAIQAALTVYLADSAGLAQHAAVADVVPNESFTPMVARETMVYLGRSGGFDVRDCPEPEALATFIAAACNRYAVTPPTTVTPTVVIDLDEVAIRNIRQTYEKAFGPMDPNITGNDIDFHICEIIKEANTPTVQDDELHYNAQRLRNVAQLVGVTASGDDEQVDNCRAALLGQIAAVLRKERVSAKGPADQWVWCGESGRMPPKNKYCLIARKSGYLGVKYEFMTAQYDADYKGWTDVGNTRITESGDNPCWWYDGLMPEMPAEPIAPPPAELEVVDWKKMYEELSAKVNKTEVEKSTGRKFFGQQNNNRE